MTIKLVGYRLSSILVCRIILIHGNINLHLVVLIRGELYFVFSEASPLYVIPFSPFMTLRS